MIIAQSHNKNRTYGYLHDLVGFQDYKDIICIYHILENILLLIAMEQVGR